MDIELSKSIRVSIVYPEEVEEEMEGGGSHYLTDTEIVTLHQFDTRRAQDWLAGHMAAKKALVAHHDVSFQKISVGYKKSGQPFYNGQSGFCSISHSYGWGAAAFSAETCVGIDIELSRPHDSTLLTYVAEVEERKHISDLDFDFAVDLTTLLWVAKEAIMKAEGVGLTHPRNLHIVSAVRHTTLPMSLIIEASTSFFSCQLWNVYVYIMQGAYIAVALPKYP